MMKRARQRLIEGWNARLQALHPGGARRAPYVEHYEDDEFRFVSPSYHVTAVEQRFYTPYTKGRNEHLRGVPTGLQRTGYFVSREFVGTEGWINTYVDGLLAHKEGA